MNEIKIDTEIQAVPGTCCEQVVGDKIIMYGVIQCEHGISLDYANILGERPLKGSEFDPDSAAYKESMERIRCHYAASGVRMIGE